MKRNTVVFFAALAAFSLISLQSLFAQDAENNSLYEASKEDYSELQNEFQEDEISEKIENNDDDLFSGEMTSSSYSDDDLFGGTTSSYSDDDLFGGTSSSYSDDDLFGGTTSSDDDFFGNSDDMFMDDGIEEWTPPAEEDNALSHGVLFDTGSIKLGGTFTTQLGTSTTIRSTDQNDDTTIWQNIADTSLTPTLNAQLSIDARPSQTLRLYMKGDIGLSASYSGNSSTSSALSNLSTSSSSGGLVYEMSSPEVSELFTDFSYGDRIFFRFGLHTVSWGTGYFFSPVSDMINTSSINPEDVSEQVDGAVNLRAQITFPGTQNCLWLYLIPPLSAQGVSTSLDEDQLNELENSGYDYSTMPGSGASQEAWQEWIESQTSSSGNSGSSGNSENSKNLYNIYLKHLALAGKYELVLGGWELGFGGLYKYENPPKIMTTFSGSVYHGKIAVFGEALYQYGSQTQWNKDKTWSEKDSIFQFTVGAMRMLSEQNMTIAAQYYYDGNNSDLMHKYFTYGHNLAAVVSFSQLFDSSDWSATLFGMINFGKGNIEDDYPNLASSSLYDQIKPTISSFLSQATIYANLTYTPMTNLSFSIGPYISIPDFDSDPNVYLRFTATLGGGKF